MQYELHINDLEFRIPLGITMEERKIPRVVLIQLQLIFMDLPSACFDDSIDSLFCYDKLGQFWQQTIINKHFQTIEYLGKVLWDSLITIMPQGTKAKLVIIKHQPPTQVPMKSVSAIFSQKGEFL